MYVYDLTPSRGPAVGGSEFTVHGTGFAQGMACQVGRHTVRAHRVSTIGDMLECVAPRFDHMGGFVAVGITIIQVSTLL